MAESKPIIKLHWLNGSRAQGILFLLEELEVPYELQVYHRTKDMLAPPELAELHPLGKSPVVTITTQDSSAPPLVLAESGFIIDYLCDHFGAGKNLVPKRWKDGQEGKPGGETEEWLRFRYLLYYPEGSLAPYLFMTILLNGKFPAEPSHNWLSLVACSRGDRALTGRSTGLKGSRIPFLVRPITSAVASRVMGMLVVPNLKKQLGFLEKQLETSPGGGDYLCGKDLTAGDISLAFPILWGKTEFGGMGLTEADFPRAFAYMERLEARPGWKRAADKIREMDGSYSLLPQH
ncbi:hypothetical protein RB601_007333 [Gaeumannomyces tritici]